MSLKILVIGNTPNARTTGMGRCIHYQADEWKKTGHCVDLLFAEDIPNGIPSKRLQTILFPWLILLTMFRLWKKNGQHDIVHIHSTDAAPYVLLKKWNPHWPPCIVISYGADEIRWELEKEEERLGLRKIRFFSKLFYPHMIVRQARYATKHCDHIFVAASYEASFYHERYNVPIDKVSFVPNGVSDDFFIEREHKSSKRLLYFGGWEWRKGIRYLREAFEKLVQEDAEVSLSIVGTGGNGEAIRAVFSPEARKRIQVIPYVEAPKAPKIYADHDIFVFPSLFESMSLVVPEAMASGMPVVTTRACGMQDIVEDGKSGLLVTPRNADEIVRAVKQILNDLKLRKRLGDTAQEAAKRIRWETVANQEINVSQKVLKKCKG